MLRTVAFLALLALASAAKLEVDNCPSGEQGVGSITEVYSSNFTEGADILLVKGQTYVFGIRFTAGESSVSLKPTIYGIILGVKVEWNGVNQQACQDLLDANKCPLVAGRSYHYSASIEVLKSYPATSLTFQWALTSADASGKKGNHQTCFRMPARIVSA